MISQFRSVKFNATNIYLFGLILPVLGNIAVHLFVCPWLFEHLPLHAVVESLGSLAAFNLAVVLFLLRKYEKGPPYYVWLSCALVGMGILDLFHASTVPGSSFVWLRSMATLVGGLLAAMVWLPERISRSRFANFCPFIVLILTIIFGLYTLIFPHAHPIMQNQGIFTPAAKAINFFGGFFFILSAIHSISYHRFTKNSSEITFIILWLLFGTAGLLFQFSHLWEADWWYWHLVRLLAYLIALWYEFITYQQTEKELKKLNETLEQRVLERTAQLEAANKELEAFSYSVSHDLRAPLRSIDGFSQALLEDYTDKLDEHGKDYLQRVRTASQRMAQLIDDMLKLSRITRSEMRWSKVNLSKLVHTIAAELQKTQPERKVEFIIAEGITANGDTSLMQVMLDNLLSNAWKFTGRLPQARIEFGVTEKVYFISDNGVGFDMAYADKLFGAFQRLHSSSDFSGSGIGLSIVQRIIHRHNGHIWAESKIGGGTTFYFTI